MSRRTWRLVLALALLIPVLVGAYRYRLAAEIDSLSAHAGQRLALASASLNAELQRFESLPAVLAEHPALRELLSDTANPDRLARVNALLQRTSERTGAAMLYLIDPTGNTVAASNWARPDSFVGQNYAFRPYFREALAGGTGMFFAVGATTRIPGFFLAHPVFERGRIVGVIAAKVELTLLERTWSESGESLMVVDQHGVVALSSNAAWKFGALRPLSEASQRSLADTRQYFTETLAPLPLEWLDAQRILLGGREFVVQSRALQWSDWRMLMLADTAPAHAAARGLAAAVGLSLCVLIVGALYWTQRSRRLRERLAAQAVLERTVAERTADLAETNRQLLREIEERAAAEQKLRGAQRALIEANRLAALGQMSAGIVHELNQPLAALRGFAGNGLTFLERGQYAPLEDNLKQIIGLVERMARLTAQLKVFASRQSRNNTDLHAEAAAAPAPARATIDTVVGWFAGRLERAGVRLDVSAEPIDLPIDAQALEQILSNLIGNALDALAGRTDAWIRVRVLNAPAGPMLAVEDNGPGIPDELRERIMQPFFSTKPLGQGLGLGLPIVNDLVEASGGRLEIVAREGGGTGVRASWPAANAAQRGRTTASVEVGK